MLRRAHPKGGRRKGRRPRTGDLIVKVSRRGLLVVGGSLVDEALPRGEHVQDGGHAVRGRLASSASSSSRPSGNTRVSIKPGFISKRHPASPGCVLAFVSRFLATRTPSHSPYLRASFSRLACTAPRVSSVFPGSYRHGQAQIVKKQAPDNVAVNGACQGDPAALRPHRRC